MFFLSRMICIDCGPRSAGEANLMKCSCLFYHIVQDLAANRLSSGRFWLFCALFCFETLGFLCVGFQTRNSCWVWILPHI